MIGFSTIIKQFAEQGEKTGWTYIEVPAVVAEKLLPGNKKSFRVKGRLDDYNFKGIALLPMGEGNFIMALKADIRKQIRKRRGDKLNVMLEADNSAVKLNSELMECLADDPEALAFFNKLTPGHRRYYSNWIESAKTIETKAKRIAQAVSACAKKQHYGQMIRSLKKDKDELMQ